MFGEISASVKMRAYRMGKRKILVYLSIPILFILTAFVLTFRLFGETSEVREGRSKLIANRIASRPHENVQNENYLRFESSYNSDPLEKMYDVDKLLMLGMVKTVDDEDKKENGMTCYIGLDKQNFWVWNCKYFLTHKF